MALSVKLWFWHNATRVLSWIGRPIVCAAYIAREKHEALVWQWWEDHPEAKAELEKIAGEIAEDMNLKERLFPSHKTGEAP